MSEPINMDEIDAENEVLCRYKWSYAQAKILRYERVSVISMPRKNFDALIENKSYRFSDEQ